MPIMLNEVVEAPIAWRADTPLSGEDGYALSADALAEINEVAGFLENNPLPIEALLPNDFDLPHCHSMMASIKGDLDDGCGFALIRGLPWAELSKAQAKAIHWLLMSMLGQTVAQKWNGEMVYDVIDTGRKEALGAGVRGSKTNGHQGYHTDNSYNLPPNYVGLTCLQPAMQGGLNGLVSFYTVHNELLQHHPVALQRLYEPFFFERYDEFAPGESSVSSKPIFSFDGSTLSVALSTGRIRMGYRAKNQEMDAATADALATLDAVLEEPSLCRNFDFSIGDTQIINNPKLGHRRTGYTDWPEPERKRHLVRIWVRNEGRRFYAG